MNWSLIDIIDTGMVSVNQCTEWCLDQHVVAEYHMLPLLYLPVMLLIFAYFGREAYPDLSRKFQLASIGFIIIFIIFTLLEKSKVAL